MSKTLHPVTNLTAPPAGVSPTLSVALVGAIAGGVVAVLVIAILVLTVVVILLTCLRKSSNKDAGAIKGETIYSTHLLQAYKKTKTSP